MRNLKKFLALVLAMMMTFSLMVTVNASVTSDFTDADSITKEFREAVAVLEGLDVFTGYTNGDKFDFRPKNNITRAEVATIVYRLATGDVKGDQAHLYADYQKFDDVKSDHWAAGYINYCANAEWIAGYGNGKFGPNDQVTGYQAAAMILRAVGYGKNKEFTGPSWQVQVANVTRSKGLLENVNKTTYANTLNKAAPRELVAEILFQAGLIPQVTWTVLGGYSETNQALGGGVKNADLAWENFELNVSNYQTVDKWGRPGYYWVTGNTLEDDLSNVVATITDDPVKTYDTAVKECDVAHDLDFDGFRTYDLYVNRNTPITSQYRIEATDTVTRVGGQGRITEFYATKTHPWSNRGGFTARTGWTQSVVMIDTYLATVTRVTERVLDPQGHEIYPSYLYLDVHDGQAVGPANKTDAYERTAAVAGVADTVNRNTSAHVASKKGANWEYAVGDKVLVQGYTDYTQKDALYDVDTNNYNADGDSSYVDNGSGLNHNLDVTAQNKAAFETNILGTDDTKINVVQKAEFKTGKQTVTYWNSGKHTVDGTDYNDQMTLFLDVAGTTTNTTFAWYFDTKGNLIGIDNVPNTVNYGVITSIWTSFNQGETNTDGTAKTYAKVLYADGTDGTITIDRFLTTQTVAGAGGGDFGTTGHIAPTTAGTAAPALSIAAAGNTAELIPVYDYNVSSGSTMAGAPRSGDAKDASYAGYLHIAPVASINDAQDENDNAKYGIIRDNLFKFEASADGNMTVIEVAGDGTNAGKFVGHYYTKNDDNSAANKTGKLFKSYGYLSVDGGANAFARLDANTRIMVRGWDASKPAGSRATDTVNCYTLSTLPGDITIAPETEIDWTDTNGDGRADVVYITGTAQGTITYGLFYYNGGAAQWNGVDKTGTAFGWLNGEPTTINFDDETELNLIKNSQGYKGHLFALQLTNGVVSNVMGEDTTNTAHMEWLLNVETTQAPKPAYKIDGNVELSTTITSGGVTAISGAFGLGSANAKNGNPYTTATEMIYVPDVAPASGTDSVSYDPSTRTVIVWQDDNSNGVWDSGETDATYYLTPGSKVIGLGMGVNQESAILDYLNKSTTNDVTIVYEQSAVKSIVEIYVATDPNVTPGTDVGAAAPKSISGPNTMIVTSTSNDTLTNNLKIAAATGNRVLFDKGTGVFGGDSIPGKTLFFPFLSVEAGAAVLRVWDKSTGEVKWAENMSAATIDTAGAPYAFYFDFTQYRSGVTAIVNNLPLSPGATYAFSITQGTTVVSSGEFTVD